MGSVPLRKKKSNNGRQTSQHGSAQKPGIDSQEKQQREGNKNEAECNERGRTLVSLYRIVRDQIIQMPELMSPAR